jgi:Protein of unknown function (DUF2511)
MVNSVVPDRQLIVWTVLAGSIAIAVTACLGARHGSDRAPTVTDVGAAGSAILTAGQWDPPLGARGGYISQMTWAAGPWPFTVSDGVVACHIEGPVQVHTFTSDGVVYALNFAARDTGRYRPVESIWRQDPRIPNIKITLASVIDYARTLCGP